MKYEPVKKIERLGGGRIRGLIVEENAAEPII
jgi:hypothetical protein